MRSFPWIAAALAGALACGFEAGAQNTVYKWTDSEGKVHFSDTPPADQKGVTQRRMGGGEVDTSQLPYATQQAAKTNPVTLYTAPQCGDPCASARSLLGSRGVPYSERNAQASHEFAGAERFCEIVVGSVVESGDLLSVLIANRNDNNRRMEPLAK